jgi:hypothetical protein
VRHGHTTNDPPGFLRESRDTGSGGADSVAETIDEHYVRS